jgi:hypothetical protein
MPSASHAGTIQRRTTLFGEIGLPDHVENISASGSRRLTCSRQSPISFIAASERGICRTPAAVFGVPNLPS